ncbi:MAG: hypothetical protein JXR37_20145 [Kiritimatiellae bacterium]|nr:hypothetical protein [Kiritimatiellia bacterium]
MSATVEPMAAGVRIADCEVIRRLVDRYLELAYDPVMDERRDLWRRLHNLERVRPPIWVRGGRFWDEITEANALECEDPFLRGQEKMLRQSIHRFGFNDDYIVEPWLTVRAALRCRDWGVHGQRTRPAASHGAWKDEYPLQDLADIGKLRMPFHEIDEAATQARVDKLRDVVGDRIEIDVDRSPAYVSFAGDLSTALGRLRGIENFMLDMYDNPGGLHRLMAFMRDGVLATHDQAEAAGDWGLTSHQNQAMTYGAGLPEPKPNTRGVPRAQLWAYAAAQEFTLVSPQFHEEFLLRYQMPILAPFGMVAYGCCEDLSNKIDMLRRNLPNLRRIAVAPAANVRRCAEQIGTDYVICYRPSPADMVCCGYDEGRIRRIVGDALESLCGKVFDVMLKDIDTVQGDQDRLRRWVAVVRTMVEAV